MHDFFYYDLFLDYLNFRKFAERKQKKKTGANKNDDSVAMSSLNAPGDESHKALTGDVRVCLCVFCTLLSTLLSDFCILSFRSVILTE